jgi:hypothetical protein
VRRAGYAEDLRRVAACLCDEFARPGPDGSPADRGSSNFAGGPSRALAAEDEALVLDLCRVLATIATTQSTPEVEAKGTMIEIAVHGAEFVMRGELLNGNGDRVLELMPSFVFLVILAATDRERALEISRRTTELIDQLDS